ncbi:MAG: ABC transporter permease [Solirubrobacterales bacterium]
MESVGDDVPAVPDLQIRTTGWARRVLVSVLPPIAVFAALLAAWEIFIDVTDQPAYVIPHLSAIAQSMGDDRGVLLEASWITAQEILVGLAIGVVVGLALAVLLAQSRIIGRAVYPLVIGSQAVPVIVIAPVFVIWFGFGMLPKVLVAALITFFPIVINTIAGLNSIDRETISLMRVLQASRWTTFWKVRVPGSLPFVFAGLKNAAVIATIGAIVGEWVGAERGLGPLMIASNATFDASLTFAAIVYLALMAMALFVVVLVAERLVIPWYFLSRRAQS